MRRELITMAEFARRRGISRAAVTKAHRSGRLVLVNGMVDVSTAAAQWVGNTQPQAHRMPAGPGAEAGHQGGDTGAEAGHSPAYAAVLAYLEGTADRLAPLLARESSPARMRGHLRTVMRAIAEELERVGLV